MAADISNFRHNISNCNYNKLASSIPSHTGDIKAWQRQLLTGDCDTFVCAARDYYDDDDDDARYFFFELVHCVIFKFQVLN